MRLLISYALGLLFGLGLSVAGMINPSKVLAFLDIAGPWDPSLALVMGAAIAVGLGLFRYAAMRDRTLLGDAMSQPAKTQIDAPLVVGSAIFGLGWGMSGVCPGPAIVDLATFDAKIWIFFFAMLVGMILEQSLLPKLMQLWRKPGLQDG